MTQGSRLETPGQLIVCDQRNRRDVQGMPGSDGDGRLVEQVSLRRLPSTAMGSISQAGFESGVDRGRRRDGFPAILSLPGKEPAKLTSSCIGQ